MFNASVIRQWWPTSEAEKAEHEEPARFRATLGAIRSCWESKEHPDLIQKWSRIDEWGHIANRMALNRFMTDIPKADVNEALLLFLDIVISSFDSPLTNVSSRWARVVRSFVATYRHQITVTIPWRPLYDHLSKRLKCQQSPSYRGQVMGSAQDKDLLSLIRKARRFFPQGSATEIWEELGPLLSKTHTMECMIAVGWMRLIFPTRELIGLEPGNGGDWNQWVTEWLDLWDSMIHVDFWNAAWSCIFARLAKHDRNNVIDWRPLLARINTHISWAIKVPIGTASTTPPFGKVRMSQAVFFFGDLHGKQILAVGKIFIWLLHRCELSDGEEDPVLLSMERLGQLLEQYFHPSNTGKWAKALGIFLRTIAHHLGKWTTFHHAKAIGCNVDDLAYDEDDVDVEKMGSHQSVEVRNGDSSQQDALFETQKRVAHAIVKLATKAQFSKDVDLAAFACDALARTTSYIPEASIPIILNHFQMALDTVTAHQQLVSAIRPLALSLRAILLVGAKQPEDSDVMDTDTSPRVYAAQAVALAMNATLPGIDANDEDKTNAVFRMYATILCTIGNLEEEPKNFPLFTEDWLEGFFSRIFAILVNVDPMQTRADTASNESEFELDNSFLVTQDCMFKPVVSLLVARLPASLRSWTVQHVARFINNTYLTTVEELAYICEELCRWAPEEVIKYIIEPLLAKLETDHLQPLALELERGEKVQLSKVRASSITWHVMLLDGCFCKMGSHLLLFKDRILSCLEILYKMTSIRILTATSDLLESVLKSLLGSYPKDACAAAPYMTGTDRDGAPMEQWIHARQIQADGIVEQFAPTWHVSKPEEVAFAEELVARFLIRPSRELADISRDKSLEPTKEHLISLFNQIEICLSVLAKSLPDVEHPGKPIPGDSLAVHCKIMAVVGSPAVRQEVLQCLLLAARHDFTDPVVLKNFMCVLAHVIPHEPNDTQSRRREAVSNDLAVLHDLPEFGLLTGETGKWRKRCTRWLSVQTSSIYLSEKATEAVRFQHLTTVYPFLPSDHIPPIVKDLAVELLRYSLLPYPGTNDQASTDLTVILHENQNLAPYLLPILLCAVAGLPLPGWKEVRASMDTDLAHGKARIISSDLISQLARKAMSSSDSAKLPQLSAAEMRAEQNRVQGAVNLIWTCAPFRTMSLDPSVMIAFALTQLCGLLSRHPVCVETVNGCLTLFSVKFETPSYLLDSEILEDEDMKLLVETLLSLGASESSSHWRLKVAANVILAMLMPPRNSQEATRITKHFFGLLHNPLTAVRYIGFVYFVRIFSEQGQTISDELRDAASEAVASSLSEQPDWGSKYLEVQAHSKADSNLTPQEHSQIVAKERKNTLLANCISMSLHRTVDWPDGRPSPAAMNDGSFTHISCRLSKRLARLAPEAVLATLKGPLERDLSGAPQQDKRSATISAIEVLAGLLSSGVVFTSNGSETTAWEEWVKPLLSHALSVAPQDYAETWACGLRYAVFSLASVSPEGLQHILDLLTSQSITSGDETQPIVKKLKTLGHASAELSALDCLGCKPYDADQDPVRAAGQKFLFQVLGELPKLAESSGEAIRRHVASTSAVVLAALLREPSQQAVMRGKVAAKDSPELRKKVHSFLDFLVQSMQEGVEFVAEHERQHKSDDTSTSLQNGTSALIGQPKVARLGTALQVVQQSLRGAERLCAIQMRPTLLKMLPYLLRIQEIAAPELNSLAMEAKSMLSYLKYLPIPPEDVGIVIQILVDASKEEQWWCRAAALVFLQYFWFRHIFLMTPQQAKRCQDVVLELIKDRKLEIQEAAANTLAGMIKGLSEEAFQKLQNELLARLDELVPKKAQRGRRPELAGEDSQARNVELHAVVLSLKAFVLSTPYDVPKWLPDILLAMSRVASRPNPVKATVRKTMSEFKRTHEEAGITDFRRMLTEDQWETLQGISNTASYFA